MRVYMVTGFLTVFLLKSTSSLFDSICLKSFLRLVWRADTLAKVSTSSWDLKMLIYSVVIFSTSSIFLFSLQHFGNAKFGFLNGLHLCAFDNFFTQLLLHSAGIWASCQFPQKGLGYGHVWARWSNARTLFFASTRQCLIVAIYIEAATLLKMNFSSLSSVVCVVSDSSA